MKTINFCTQCGSSNLNDLNDPFYLTHKQCNNCGNHILKDFDDKVIAISNKDYYTNEAFLGEKLLWFRFGFFHFQKFKIALHILIHFY